MSLNLLLPHEHKNAKIVVGLENLEVLADFNVTKLKKDRKEWEVNQIIKAKENSLQNMRHLLSICQKYSVLFQKKLENISNV